MMVWPLETMYQWKWSGFIHCFYFEVLTFDLDTG